jgi:type IV pilus assembly protein PilE
VQHPVTLSSEARGRAKRPAPASRHRRHRAGLTLVEALIGLAMATIAAAIALPTYTEFLRSGRLPDPRADLEALRQSLDRHVPDAGDNPLPHCAAAAIAGSTRVRYTCAMLDFGQGVPAAATGIALVAVYSFTLDTARAGAAGYTR